MKKMILLTALSAFMVAMPLTAADVNVGFINFKKCIESSKQGQQEKNAFEALKNQMNTTLEKTDKELSELAKKLEDQDYLDGLSPKAEEELKQKFQALSQDFSRYQNQYYQLLNQANYKMLQTMHDKVSHAAEKVRTKQDLALIFNEDSAFAFASSLDLTDAAVKEMDIMFDLENSSDAVASISR